jgi:hypothetical protein
MKMLRGESGIALRPVFHLGDQYWELFNPIGSSSRNAVCSRLTLSSAGFNRGTDKTPISRTTKARPFMKHGFSARPFEPGTHSLNECRASLATN